VEPPNRVDFGFIGGFDYGCICASFCLVVTFCSDVVLYLHAYFFITLSVIEEL